MTTRKELLPGVFLTSIQDGRFKTACFSLSFLRPLRAGEAAMNALLPSVLLRGSEKTPSIRALADRLDELHGASIGALVRKKGEIQLTGLFADCLEDQYAGEAVFSHLLDFVSELLFCPRTEHGAFVPELVSQECRNLQNAMQSVLDDKSAYCERQLLRAMCRGERYACGRLGEPEELDKIDVRTLWAHDKSVLASSRVELFYLGSKSVGEAEALLQPLLAHLPRTACVPVGTNPSPLPQELRRFSETMPLAQSRISLGFRTDVTLRSAQYPAMLLLNAMLGGGEQNRLYTVVRGRMALCYEAGSWYDGHKGILAASAGCGRTDPAGEPEAGKPGRPAVPENAPFLCGGTEYAARLYGQGLCALGGYLHRQGGAAAGRRCRQAGRAQSPQGNVPRLRDPGYGCGGGDPVGGGCPPGRPFDPPSVRRPGGL